MIDNLISSLPVMFQGLANDVLLVLYLLSPIYSPFFLGIIFWELFRHSKRYAFRLKQDYILLELKLPKEIKKTPLAMELFLNTLYQTGGEGTWYDRNFLGKSRPCFSLEMVSIEGQVKFFVRAEKRFKNLIESQLYAQYPELEIYEAPDYTKFFDFNPEKSSMWANEFITTNKIDAYPIKTYVDYGLDREGIKDEEKIDPITPIIEFLGSVGRGEQLWIQIMVRAHKKELKKDLEWKAKLEKMKWSENVDWTEAGKAEKEKLLTKLKPPEGQFPRIATKGEQAIIAAIERNIDKPGFDVGIRGIYLSEKEKFNPINITGLTGTFKQFNSPSLNGFRPSGGTAFDYPWQDYKNIRVNKKKSEMINLYKRRAYFHYPYRNDNQFVLSIEELATIFHLPGGVVQTPTFSRITSKRAEPPINLPF